jgi:hypothetical protein
MSRASAAKQTTMSAAFEKAGYSKADMILFAAATNYLQSGGTVSKAAEIFVEAQKRLQGGHVAFDSHNSNASSQRDGAGQHNVGTRIMDARAAREPSEADKKAAGRTRNVIAITVFDSFKVRDGRSIGQVSFGELERLRYSNAHEAAVVRQILNHVTSADHAAKIKDLIKARDLQRFIQRASEIADAT